MVRLLKNIFVLGVPYSVYEGTEMDFPTLKNCDGYCDTSVKKIVINDMSDVEGEPDAKKDLASYKKTLIRHELVHATLYESGLASETWADNEEIVDWIAIQFPKMWALFETAGCVD